VKLSSFAQVTVEPASISTLVGSEAVALGHRDRVGGDRLAAPVSTAAARGNEREAGYR